MRAAKLQAILDSLGLSVARAARICLSDVTTVRRWLWGATSVPGPADQLFWLLDRYPELMGELERRAIEIERGKDE